MREKYIAQLEELQAQLAVMQSLAEKCLHSGANVEGAQCQQGDFAKGAPKDSSEISSKNLTEIELSAQRLSTLEKDIFHSCEMLILKQQPVAQDLEFITRSIRQILDLRRIGEISLNCAKIIEQTPRSCHLELLSQMAGLLFAMFEAYKAGDSGRVEEIEYVLDSCFKEIKSQIAAKITSDYENAHFWLEMLMLSKYFEKLGDHISALVYA